MFKSPFRPDMNEGAVAVLIPTSATPMTVPPATGSGLLKRRMASQVIAPIERRRNMAFKSAARMEEPAARKCSVSSEGNGKAHWPQAGEESQDITQVVTRIGNQSKGVPGSHTLPQ